MVRVSKRLTVGIGLLALAVGLSLIGQESYCQRCGVRRHRTGWALFGIQVYARERTTATGFSLLYTKYVGPDSDHLWRANSNSRIGLLNGGIGCGYLPSILLLRPAEMSGVERLGDARRTQTVIRSFNLTKQCDHAAEDKRFVEVRDLGAVKTRVEADRWWRKHGAEFERAAKRAGTGGGWFCGLRRSFDFARKLGPRRMPTAEVLRLRSQARFAQDASEPNNLCSE